jgi:hypothetical protein
MTLRKALELLKDIELTRLKLLKTNDDKSLKLEVRIENLLEADPSTQNIYDLVILLNEHKIYLSKLQ